MFSYILDAIFVRQELLGLEWAWSLAETIVNTYFKLLSERSFRGASTWLSDHFFTPVYKMIFEQDPPCMSTEAMEALLDIANCYASPSENCIQMFSTEKPPHVLPKFSFDILVM